MNKRHSAVPAAAYPASLSLPTRSLRRRPVPNGFAALVRRLDAAALDQLRHVAAQQARVIDTLRDEIATLRDRLAAAEDSADEWQSHALQVAHTLREAAGAALGIDRSGRLVLLADAGEVGQ